MCQWDVGVHMVREEGGIVLDAANSNFSLCVCMCVHVHIYIWVQKSQATVVSIIHSSVLQEPFICMDIYMYVFMYVCSKVGRYF